MNIRTALETAFYRGYDMGKDHGIRITEHKYSLEGEKRNEIKFDIDTLASKVEPNTPDTTNGR